jgi:hypothetical protein
MSIPNQVTDHLATHIIDNSSSTQINSATNFEKLSQLKKERKWKFSDPHC